MSKALVSAGGMFRTNIFGLTRDMCMNLTPLTDGHLKACWDLIRDPSNHASCRAPCARDPKSGRRCGEQGYC